MYAPRRHTRRLLLPPGWVALGFLLLLGCQALLAHRRQMQVEYKLELAMPIPEKMASEFNFSPHIRPFTKPLADVKPTTHWHTINFNGGKLNDFASGAMVVAAMRSIDEESTYAAGIKVCFQQGATYSSLMATLDLMNQLNHPRYWLDIEHQSTAFYAVNGQAIKIIREAVPAPRYLPLCISPLPEKYEPPVLIPSFWQIAQQNFASLWQQPWQPVALLITSIAALSFYRLALPRPSRR